MSKKQPWIPTRRCTVSWGMDHQCYEPATHYAYPTSTNVPPLVVCNEHAYRARLSNFRVEPIQDRETAR